MFDLLKLSYIRTFIVDVKSGFNNLKSEDEDDYNKDKDKKVNYRLDIKRTKRKKNYFFQLMKNILQKNQKKIGIQIY